MFRSLFFFVFAALLASISVHASFPAPSGTLYGAQSFVTGNYFPADQPSVAAACDVAYQQVKNGYGVSSVTPGLDGARTCTFNYNGGSWVGGVQAISGLVCPVNSTQSSGQCTCASGYSESGSSCVLIVNPCAAKTGKPQITNITLCYFRTPNDGSSSNCVTTPAAVAAELCDGGCTVAVGDISDAWVSQQPTSQGLYRASVDYQSVPTGAQCTMSPSSPADKAAPNPPCPGFVGEINGKTTCVGTAAQPLPTNTLPRSAAGAQPGNPAAGEKPLIGEGSGTTGATRTPAAGDGGAAGGPAAGAGAASSGTSPTVAGQEQLSCGAPGQPKCSLDESGTPRPFDSGAFSSKADKYKTDVDSMRGTVSGTSDKNFFGGWSAAFVAPPIAECTPFELPFFKGSTMGSIDPCPVAGGMRSVMAWLWALGGLVLCLGMVRKVI